MSTNQDVQKEIEVLRRKIDELDTEILSAINRRTEVSRTIGRLRRGGGEPAIDPSREQVIYAKYAALGDEGNGIVELLLQLGRGKLNESKDKGVTND